MKRFFLAALVFAGLSLSLGAQADTIFTLVAEFTGTTQLTDSTFNATANHPGDQLGQGWLPGDIEVGYRIFDGFGRMYEITVINSTTFETSDLEVKELQDWNQGPAGTGVIFRKHPDHGRVPVPLQGFGGLAPAVVSRIHIHNVLNGGGGISGLADLSDVSDATATDGFVLVANGTTFAARALVEADISDLGSYWTGSGSGTTNTLPLWTGSATLGNSWLRQSGDELRIRIDGTNDLIEIDDSDELFRVLSWSGANHLGNIRADGMIGIGMTPDYGEGRLQITTTNGSTMDYEAFRVYHNTAVTGDLGLVYYTDPALFQLGSTGNFRTQTLRLSAGYSGATGELVVQNGASFGTMLRSSSGYPLRLQQTGSEDIYLTPTSGKIRLGQEVVFYNVGSPSTLESGEAFFDTDDNRFKIHNGTTEKTVAWFDDIPANHLTSDGSESGARVPYFTSSGVTVTTAGGFRYDGSKDGLLLPRARLSPTNTDNNLGEGQFYYRADADRLRVDVGGPDEDVAWLSDIPSVSNFVDGRGTGTAGTLTRWVDANTVGAGTITHSNWTTRIPGQYTSSTSGSFDVDVITSIGGTAPSSNAELTIGLQSATYNLAILDSGDNNSMLFNSGNNSITMGNTAGGKTSYIRMYGQQTGRYLQIQGGNGSNRVTSANQPLYLEVTGGSEDIYIQTAGDQIRLLDMVVLHNTTSPATLEAGALYFNPSTGRIVYHDGTTSRSVAHTAELFTVSSTDNYIPYVNAAGTGFDYNANFLYTGSTFTAGNVSMSGSVIQGRYSTSIIELKAHHANSGINLNAASADAYVTLNDFSNTGFYVTDDLGRFYFEVEQGNNNIWLGDANNGDVFLSNKKNGGSPDIYLRGGRGTANHHGGDLILQGGASTAGGTGDGGDLFLQVANDDENDFATKISILGGQNAGQYGFVGINTATPGYQLTVNGPTQFVSTSTPTQASGVFYNNSGVPTWGTGAGFEALAYVSALGDATSIQGEDVGATSPATGDVLRYDGNSWEPFILHEYGELSRTADTTLTFTTARQTLGGLLIGDAVSFSEDTDKLQYDGVVSSPKIRVSYSIELSHSEATSRDITVGASGTSSFIVKGSRTTTVQPDEVTLISQTFTTTYIGSGFEIRLLMQLDSGADVTIHKMTLFAERLN